MIPLSLKLAYTLLVMAVVAAYWIKYGPGNFLWFSDLALIGAVPALWLESRLLASTLAALVLLPELLWNLSYFGRLLLRRRITGLTDYMFDPSKPRWLRALSLFHVVLVPLLLWTIAQLGYDRAALPAAVLAVWIVLPLSYWLTDPAENVNWVHGPAGLWEQRLPPLVYLGLQMLVGALLAVTPTHLLLLALFA